MCQYSSEDGGPTDYHLVHLGKFAMGGAGIVFCEETSVEERGRKSHHCAGIYDDAHVAAVPAHQRFPAQPGRDTRDTDRSLGTQRLGLPAVDRAIARSTKTTQSTASRRGRPSRRARFPRATPRRFRTRSTASEIREVVAQWREAALRALDAGYDIVEVHAAHGYLIHQFLSPIANLRTDDYGGDLEGRMRLCLEIVEAVRCRVAAGAPAVHARLRGRRHNSRWSVEDTIELVRAAKERGVDVVTTSSGGIHGPGTATLVPRAARLSRAVRRARAEARPA